MDAANVDLKAFTDEFTKKRCASATGARHARLPAARDRRLVRDHHALIPGLNDSPEEIEAMSKWIVEPARRAAAFHRFPPGLR
jgi:pyruvate formate lyase activating enzyme